MRTHVIYFSLSVVRPFFYVILEWFSQKLNNIMYFVRNSIKGEKYSWSVSVIKVLFRNKHLNYSQEVFILSYLGRSLARDRFAHREVSLPIPGRSAQIGVVCPRGDCLSPGSEELWGSFLLGAQIVLEVPNLHLSVIFPRAEVWKSWKISQNSHDVCIYNTSYSTN